MTLHSSCRWSATVHIRSVGRSFISVGISFRVFFISEQRGPRKLARDEHARMLSVCKGQLKVIAHRLEELCSPVSLCTLSRYLRKINVQKNTTRGKCSQKLNGYPILEHSRDMVTSDNWWRAFEQISLCYYCRKILSLAFMHSFYFTTLHTVLHLIQICNYGLFSWFFFFSYFKL